MHTHIGVYLTLAGMAQTERQMSVVKSLPSVCQDLGSTPSTIKINDKMTPYLEGEFPKVGHWVGERNCRFDLANIETLNCLHKA